MKLQHCLALALVVALASCGPQRQPQQPTRNANSPVLPAESAPPGVSNSAPSAPPQRKATVDPKSTQAALDIAQKFADLLDRRKFDEAYAMLGSESGFSSAADLSQHFAAYSGLHVTIIKSPPPSPEGAAGSVYLSVPAAFSGTVEGRHVEHSATITMRRVNDVPGSTEAQRRWHIERFEDMVM